MACTRWRCLSRTWLAPDRIWLLVIFGVLQIVFAFQLTVVYFSVRALTSSLEHVETVPSYAGSILLMCAGIVVTFCSKTGDPILLLAASLLSSICLLLNLCSATLIGRRTLHMIYKFDFCHYVDTSNSCHCYMIGGGTVDGHNAVNAELDVVYRDSPSCTVIEENLREFIGVLCGLHSAASFLSFVTAIMTMVLLIRTRASTKHSERVQLADNMTPNPSEPCPPSAPSGVDTANDDRIESQLTRFSRNITLPGMNAPLLAPTFRWTARNESGEAVLTRIQQTNVMSDNEATRRGASDISRTQPPRTETTPYDDLMSRSPSLQIAALPECFHQGDRRYLAQNIRNLWQLYNRMYAHNRHAPSYLHTDRYSRRAVASGRSRHRHDNVYPPRNPNRHVASRRQGRQRRGRRRPVLDAPNDCMPSITDILPYPHEPPPPYQPTVPPVYIEHDPAPSYRSRETTPRNSVVF